VALAGPAVNWPIAGVLLMVLARSTRWAKCSLRRDYGIVFDPAVLGQHGLGPVQHVARVSDGWRRVLRSLLAMFTSYGRATSLAAGVDK